MYAKSTEKDIKIHDSHKIVIVHNHGFNHDCGFSFHNNYKPLLL